MGRLLKLLREWLFELLAGLGLLWAKLTGIHVCADEVFAVFAILGGVKYVPGWVRSKWSFRHTKFRAGSCHHEDGHDHGERS